VTTHLVHDEQSLERSIRLLEKSVGEKLRKNRVFVKIVEAVRLPENVDGS